ENAHCVDCTNLVNGMMDDSRPTPGISLRGVRSIFAILTILKPARAVTSEREGAFFTRSLYSYEQWNSRSAPQLAPF
ncbi:MAG: hypothetical protein WDZ48_09625, partial [Pirellulales bacterium]